jgi:hypothetical protein
MRGTGYMAVDRGCNRRGSNIVSPSLGEFWRQGRIPRFGEAGLSGLNEVKRDME